LEQSGNSAGEFRDGRTIDLIARALAVGPVADETCFDEDLQVLGDSRLGKIDRLHDVLAATAAGYGEMPEDRQPRWMRQSAELNGKSVLARDLVFSWAIHRSSSIDDER
jgi:hypothetical protein